ITLRRKERNISLMVPGQQASGELKQTAIEPIDPMPHPKEEVIKKDQIKKSQIFKGEQIFTTSVWSRREKLNM
ncbi:hypothetical protein M9458_039935, partial [Cirrhinus mrigala]